MNVCVLVCVFVCVCVCMCVCLCVSVCVFVRVLSEGGGCQEVEGIRRLRFGLRVSEGSGCELLRSFRLSEGAGCQKVGSFRGFRLPEG